MIRPVLSLHCNTCSKSLHYFWKVNSVGSTLLSRNLSIGLRTPLKKHRYLTSVNILRHLHRTDVSNEKILKPLYSSTNQTSEGTETLKQGQINKEVNLTEDEHTANLGQSKSELLNKYGKFAATSPRIIYDANEEFLGFKNKVRNKEVNLIAEETEDLVWKRGIDGVFDVDELVNFIREDNARDVVVIRVPAELHYVNHMVIATGRSERHLIAMAEMVCKMYKRKKDEKDPFTISEGTGSSWVAMDLGNIALHFMTRPTREAYDLEMLWVVGAEFDDKSQMKPTQVLEFNLNIHQSEDVCRKTDEL